MGWDVRWSDSLVFPHFESVRGRMMSHIRDPRSTWHVRQELARLVYFSHLLFPLLLFTPVVCESGTPWTRFPRRLPGVPLARSTESNSHPACGICQIRAGIDTCLAHLYILHALTYLSQTVGASSHRSFFLAPFQL